MNEADALDALERLGLTGYEAETFLALQKLGAGSASEVASTCDVPRSQVYGTAERLADRGLVEVEQGSPTRYRPVSVEEARERLFAQLAERGQRAFDYLESVRGEESGEEEREAIWTVHGTSSIDSRVRELVPRADDRILYGASEVDHLGADIVEALERQAREGVRVTCLSLDPAVLSPFEDESDVTTMTAPASLTPETSSGRILLCDRDTVLLSVLPTEELPHLSREAAFWSADTAFATMLGAILDQWIEGLFSSTDVTE